MILNGFVDILFKYILLVRVNGKNSGWDERQISWAASVPTREICLSSKAVFSQITLTNRTYLVNSAEYLTASKTVACKQYCRLEPRILSVFFSPFKLTLEKSTLSLVEERNTSNSELHLWRHKLFKEGIFPRAGYLPSTLIFAIRNFQGQIPLRWGKSGKN